MLVAAGCATSPKVPDDSWPVPHQTTPSAASQCPPIVLSPAEKQRVADNQYARKTFEYLTREYSYPAVSSAAVVGTAIFESQANPAAVGLGGFGHGLLQMGPGKWQQNVRMAHETHRSPYDLEQQLDFLGSDLRANYPATDRTLREEMNVADATIVFNEEYQIIGSNCFAMQKALAQAAFESFS
jgi:hypothetical protein